MTIFGLSSFVTSSLMLLSFFSKAKIFLSLNKIIVDLFGWGGIFAPFVFGSFSLLPLRRKRKKSFVHIPVGGGLLLLTLLGLTSSFLPYQSGILGRELWFNLSDLLTVIGAFLVLFAGSLTGLTVLLNTSLDELLAKTASFISLILKFIRRFFLSKVWEQKKNLFEKKATLKVKGKPPLQPPPPSPVPPQKKEEFPPSLPPTPPDKEMTWQYPPLSLLSDAPSQEADRGDVKKNALIIEKTLESFGLPAQVVEVNLGPAVTQYALQIPPGIKLSRITSLANDLALALAAPTGQIRIEAPIPGRSLIGIEVPNKTLEFVTLKSILSSEQMRREKSKLAVGLGLDVSGQPVVADIAKMPHVLIAGATGSGKTVCLNSFITSILFRATPNEVKFIIIDPKRVEMTFYNGIPHLLVPIIVDLEKTLSALKWAVGEMERRYKLFAAAGVRHINGYNQATGFQALPYIVIIIDELADLMAFAPVEFEDAITRLAQMSRATGIHLVISTQRPSVDVLTGLIKANIPCRIAFNVSSMVDSRVIIDMPGAEKLLGRGDMLYIPPNQAKPTRIQGTFVSDAEVKRLVEILQGKGTPKYISEVTDQFVGKTPKAVGERDTLFEEAVRVVCEYDRASASLLQRRLKIGYARAARILDQLEAAGVVGPPEGSKPRDVLIRNAEEFLASLKEK